MRAPCQPGFAAWRFGVPEQRKRPDLTPTSHVTPMPMSNSTDAMQLTLDLFAAPPATPVAERPADPPAPAVGSPVPDTVCLLDVAAAPAERWQPRDPSLVARMAGAVPSGVVARWNANLAALTHACQLHDRLAAGGQTAEADRDRLRQWSGWGGLQSLFGTDRATQAEQAVRALAGSRASGGRCGPGVGAGQGHHHQCALHPPADRGGDVAARLPVRLPRRAGP